MHKNGDNMNIAVRYKDSNNSITDKNFFISKAAIIKHMAIVGQKHMPSLKKFLRKIGIFLHYNYYLQSNTFNKNKFSLPPDEICDPTEKGQFSNLVGRAIADFLSKKIDKAIYTVNYEAAMRMKGLSIKGKRPDLLAFNKNKQLEFAIEAKGRDSSSIRDKDMENYKQQSQSGGIPVSYTVASVAYNLYKEIKCNYYDPYNEDISFDENLFINSVKQYYSGLSEFLIDGYFEKTEYQNEIFYEVDLFRLINKFFSDYNLFQLHFGILKFYMPKLILPANISEFAKEGLPKDIRIFIYNEKDNKIYIDNDRVGLKLERNSGSGLEF